MRRGVALQPFIAHLLCDHFIWRALYKKKTLRHPKANDDARHIFQNKIQAYEQAGRVIVYLDESGFAHDMPRKHGYASRGRRCFGTQDKGRIYGEHAKGMSSKRGQFSSHPSTWVLPLTV
jgi:hypothetical protein